MSIFTAENPDQKFVWPKTKNPILKVVRLFGSSSIFFLLVLVYLSNRFLTTKIPFFIIFDFFLMSMAWLFIQQKMKVYKLLGWVIIFCGAWLTLVEFFQSEFAITPWW